jgi:hypothetical protein
LGRILKVARLLNDSLKQFVVGLIPGFVLALICVGIQYLPMVVSGVWVAYHPPQPASSHGLDFLNDAGGYGWRSDARALAGHTIAQSILFFFHALVALVLTSWLLRKRAGFDAMPVLRRAMRGAAVITCAAAVVYAAGFFIDDVLPATRYIRFDFTAAAVVVVWFAGSALLLPARLMGHEPYIESGLLKNTIVAAIALLPWLYMSELLGKPLRRCDDCGNLFEGGIFFWISLGAYLLGLTVSSAAVSAAACMPAMTVQAEA